ncbi:hypothetical protein DBR42_19985 [Pelomonas sp. HMWF004]|nr:hypothetical protein DBR42_19985 [Pelomonas sp. HMWF004]
MTALSAGVAHAQLNNVEPALGESVVFSVPKVAGQPTLELSLFNSPNAALARPLVVLSHGMTPGGPRANPRYRPDALVRYFTARGYVVAAPMRAGYADSSGVASDPYCAATYDFAQKEADSIGVAIDHLLSQQAALRIDPQRVLLVGHSAGGLSSLAYAARPVAGVRGVINLAGGWRSAPNVGWCDWSARAASAYQRLGLQVRVPSLWQYASNDGDFFPSALARNWAQAYASGGAPVNFVSLDNVDTRRVTAHTLWEDQPNMDRAAADLDRFLVSLGLPATPTWASPLGGNDPWPMGFNPNLLPDLTAGSTLPQPASNAAQQGFENFKQLPQRPRAFVMSLDGSWFFYRSGTFRPANEMLRICRQAANMPCRVIAQGEKMAWQLNLSEPNDKP